MAEYVCEYSEFGGGGCRFRETPGDALVREQELQAAELENLLLVVGSILLFGIIAILAMARAQRNDDY